MFKQISAGQNVPDDCNVVIEIPAHSEPIKYEVDKKTGALFVDRFMTATMRYPCDYGYIPNTLAEDNDPIDVLVICPFPLLSGCIVRVRPIGMLKMTDESGKDAKILAVPINKLTPIYEDIKKPGDLFPLLIEQISHFFKHYKDLEKGKWVKIEGWDGPQAARKEIQAGIARYQKSLLEEKRVNIESKDTSSAKDMARYPTTRRKTQDTKISVKTVKKIKEIKSSGLQQGLKSGRTTRKTKPKR